MRKWWLLLLVAAGACATSMAPPSPPRKSNLGLRMIPATLPNGLRAVLVSDPNAAEVQVTMRYQVGANDDPPGQEGMAHLVEHLMFQQVLGAQSLFAKLEDVTTSFTGFTTFDATTYSARATPARLGELLSVEAVRVGFRCTSITDSVFEREREVVLNELRQREASTELVLALHRALYPEGHPYRRSDSVETVAAITREQACAFADAYYAPSNAVLVVSGPITAEQLDDALRKFLAKVAARDARAPSTVPAVPAKYRRIEARAPIDGSAILIGWPLPQDPAARLTVKTAATHVLAAIQTRGFAAQHFTFGDNTAPMYGVYIALDDDERRPPDEILSQIQSAVLDVPASFRVSEPAWLSNAAFDRVKQRAIYGLFSNLEEGSDRDTMIAATVLAGLDPNTALAAQSAALGRLSRGELERLAAAHLRYDQATVAVLSPTDPVKRGTPSRLAAPVHDIGQRRDPDPEEAWRAADAIPQRAITGMRKRTLANGLDVVLLPATSVPTVEIRLVFGSGTADDRTAHRGAARAAAKALSWHPRYINDYLLFAAGGGTLDSDVGTDHTVFTARGVDMHIDFLLAGLRRWVRDGIYDLDDIKEVRADAGRSTYERTLEDTWRAALFGAAHPYAHESTVTAALTRDVVEAYRKDHHTPDNATLVIAGRFDADLADRWIDHLFADWKGTAASSPAVSTTTEPASIANDAAVSQVGMTLAIPATRGGRAERLVAAAMLNVITQDIRHQLGASYGFDVGLDEARLASTYVVSGWIDAVRARVALELVRTRLATLRSDPDVAARTFVTARRRVIVNLLASTRSAYELAERVQRDVVLGRAPLSDASTADAVRRLTLAEMPAVLQEVDLSRAVIVMHGPRATIDDTFAALGRTPQRITAIRDHEDPLHRGQQAGDEDLVPSELDAPITTQSPQPGWVFGAFAGFTTAYAADHGVDGYSVAAELGYRFKRSMTAGLYVSIASLDGTYESSVVAADPLELSVQPVQVAGFLQASPRDERIWGGLFAGVSFVEVIDNRMLEESTGFRAGAHGGYDVAYFSGHCISVYGRLEADLGTSTGFAGFTFGLGYRHR